jgi:hypothetical protein
MNETTTMYQAQSETIEETPYMDGLAARTYETIADFYPELSSFAVGHILSEGLFQAARDLREGQRVNLEYIGSLLQISGCDPRKVRFVPDHALLQPADRPNLSPSDIGMAI